jgi:pimeloyl-ACP methyl ester carboxylesterase
MLIVQTIVYLNITFCQINCSLNDNAFVIILILEMEKGLLIPGYACKSWIWDSTILKLKRYFSFEAVDWPPNLTHEFKKIRDFESWFNEKYLSQTDSYDFLIGHSMGGIVAILTYIKNKNKIKKIILTESFLKSPAPFFQNLLMDNMPVQLREKIKKMLTEESSKYNVSVREELRSLDLNNLLAKVDEPVPFIYGDRGYSNKDLVRENLQLPSGLSPKVKIYVVKNSCHFPMLENSRDFSFLIKELLFN